MFINDYYSGIIVIFVTYITIIIRIGNPRVKKKTKDEKRFDSPEFLPLTGILRQCSCIALTLYLALLSLAVGCFRCIRLGTLLLCLFSSV